MCASDAGKRDRTRVQPRPLMMAENIASLCLSLTLGDDPVLDANIVPAQRIGRERDVTRGEDARDAALEVLVDRHAPIRLDSGELGFVV